MPQITRVSTLSATAGSRATDGTRTTRVHRDHNYHTLVVNWRPRASSSGLAASSESRKKITSAICKTERHRTSNVYRTRHKRSMRKARKARCQHGDGARNVVGVARNVQHVRDCQSVMPKPDRCLPHHEPQRERLERKTKKKNRKKNVVTAQKRGALTTVKSVSFITQ